MSQHLDARQRAMLQEMGITIWAPASPVPAVAPALPEQPAAPAVALAPASTTPPAPAAAPAPPPVRPAVSRPAAAAATPVEAAPVPPSSWQIAPAVQPYALPAQASADGWLVLLESASPLAPLAGDVGRLLDQMLRALNLHRHPQLWIAGLQRPDGESLPVAGGSNLPVDWQPLDSGLQAVMAQARPARVLVLGLHSAKAVLGRQEPLGQLRAMPHLVLGVPAMVSYDPAYLLRADHAKPAAWSDLCRASGLVPTPAA